MTVFIRLTKPIHFSGNRTIEFVRSDVVRIHWGPAALRLYLQASTLTIPVRIIRDFDVSQG